ncbi:MAG: hypothetical protein U1E56_06710 [Bauldia sp.]
MTTSTLRVATARALSFAAILAATPLLAQNLPGPTVPPTQAPQGGAAAVAPDVDQPLSLDPARPFGTLDVMAAGKTQATISAWAGKLNDSQKADLKTRCDKILGASTGTYAGDAIDFCNTYKTASAGPSPVLRQN